MASNGQRGAEFERQTRDLLTRHGYTVVRSTASKTALDLVALAPFAKREGGFFPEPHTLAVQAKRDGRLDPSEWNHLFWLARGSGTVPVLAKREKVGRRYVVGLYRLTGPRAPRSRTWPMERLEVSDAAQTG